MNSYIKRIWTNRNYYRNVKPEYRDLAIWHIPNEKRNGIKKLFDYIANGQDLKSLPTVAYKKLLFDTLLAKANYKLDLFKLFKSKAYKVMKKLKFIGK